MAQKRSKRYILLDIAMFIIFIAAGKYCYDEYKNHLPVPPTNTAEFKRTVMTPVLDVRIDKTLNYVYCSVFQTAWNQLRNELVKDDIKLARQPRYIDELNKLSNQKPLLPDDYYVCKW